MSILQTRLLSAAAAGHDGPPIPEATRVYFQERLRSRIFDFLLAQFISEQKNGLTQAKLARRIGKSPEVINRWLGSPSNLTMASVSDLLLGINASELGMSSLPLINRPPTNARHLDDERQEPKGTSIGTTGGSVKIDRVLT
jgi:hypothetical protein